MRDWIRRAHRGVGVAGPFESMTTFLPGERSWGGRLIGTCAKPKPDPTEDFGDEDNGKPGKPDKPGGGGGAGW